MSITVNPNLLVVGSNASDQVGEEEHSVPNPNEDNYGPILGGAGEPLDPG